MGQWLSDYPVYRCELVSKEYSIADLVSPGSRINKFVKIYLYIGLNVSINVKNWKCTRYKIFAIYFKTPICPQLEPTESSKPTQQYSICGSHKLRNHHNNYGQLLAVITDLLLIVRESCYFDPQHINHIPKIF